MGSCVKITEGWTEDLTARVISDQIATKTKSVGCRKNSFRPIYIMLYQVQHCSRNIAQSTQ